MFPADAGAGFPVGAPDATSLSAHGAVHMLSGMVGPSPWEPDSASRD